MLPRSKSIFHLGEEEGCEQEEEAKKSTSTATTTTTTGRGGEGGGGVQGLRILIVHEQARDSNIIIKSALQVSRRTSGLASRTSRPHDHDAKSSTSTATREASGFLKTCSLCKRELSLQKEVYMYRGDQGFCSADCRYRQILVDERRELEAAATKRERLAAPHRRPAPAAGANSQQYSDRRRRISAAAA